MRAAPSRTGSPARRGTLALAAVLACRPTLGSDDRGDVEVAGRPLDDDQQARLLALAGEQGLLYWRLPGDDGPRCEPWRLVPEGDDLRERGRLVFAPPATDPPAAAAPGTSDSSDPAPTAATAAPGASDRLNPAPSDMSSETATLRLAYRLHDGHLSLSAPEHERPLAAPPGARHDLGHALTCVFTGIAVAGSANVARRVILVARERFFFTAGACAAAGPVDDPPGPDELRVLGCGSALADPGTRARLDRPPPTGAPDAASRLRRARRVHVLRRGADGRLRCDVWRNHPETGGRHGRLVHRGADERGAFTWTYAYEAGPGYLTLQGPAEVRQVELRGRATEVVRASGCLLTRSVTAVTPTDLAVGPERWYLSKSACERARRANVAGPPEVAPLLVPACE